MVAGRRRVVLGRAALPVVRRSDDGRRGAVPRLPGRVPTGRSPRLPDPVARLAGGRHSGLRARAERRGPRVRARVRGADDTAPGRDGRPHRRLAEGGARDGRPRGARARARRRHAAPPRRARPDALRCAARRPDGRRGRSASRRPRATRRARAGPRDRHEALPPPPAAAVRDRRAPAGGRGALRRPSSASPRRRSRSSCSPFSRSRPARRGSPSAHSSRAGSRSRASRAASCWRSGAWRTSSVSGHSAPASPKAGPATCGART